jgi:hypothetical protein
MSDERKKDGAKFNPAWLAMGLSLGVVFGAAIRNAPLVSQ